MRVGSLFTGIGGFDLAAEQLGCDVLWQAEIDKQCRGVLRHRFPHATLFEDVKNVTAGSAKEIDLLCGGFPCQDLSVAGRRAGLEGKRSGLWWEFHRIIKELGPDWVLVENVPGLLSSHKGEDFAILLSSLSDLGYGVSWRVLDSQFFGVAQRRRRLFIVGRAGGFCGPEILFESESMSGNPVPSREKGKEVAGTLESRSTAGGFPGTDGACSGHVVATGFPDPAYALSAGGDGDTARRFGTGRDAQDTFVVGVGGQVSRCLTGEGFDASEDGTGRGTPVVASPLTASYAKYHGAAAGKDSTPHNLVFPGPRRLTPTECERLQGFPDGWTGVDGLKDGPRYRMMGNAVTVDTVRWIIQRMVGAG